MSRHMILAVVLSAVVSTGAFAQDEKKKKTKNQKNSVQNRMTKQLMNSFAKANLTEEQKAEAKKVVAEGMKNVVAVQKQLEGMFTKEQRQKRNEVMKQARADGMTGKEVTAKANAAVGMDDAAMKEFAALKLKQNKAMSELRKKVMGLLTDDQKKLMRAGQKKGKGKGQGKGKTGPDKASA